MGFTGYYRRFVKKNYGCICKPLTELLKKDQFEWIEHAKLAFQELKKAMISPLVLALPNYYQSFMIETDACNFGIGAILMQEGHLIAYINKTLSPKHQGLSIYENELMAIVYAITKWHHYLYGRHFIIKTNIHSLKYLLQ